jgi:hypothetical protein
MKTQNKIVSVLILLLMLPLALAAQAAEPYAEVVFFDGTVMASYLPEGSTEAVLYSSIDGSLDFGTQLPVGTLIRVEAGQIEITLVPNGSLMKLAANTEMTISSLSPSTNEGNNHFNVAAGRVRTVASRLGGSAQMRVRSGSAIAGVRGTDFSFDADLNEVFVNEGLVEFGAAIGEGFDFPDTFLSINPGQFGRLQDFFLGQFSSEELAEKFDELTTFSEDGQAIFQEINQGGGDGSGEGGEGGGEGEVENEGEGSGEVEQTSTETETSEELGDTNADEPTENEFVNAALEWLGAEIGSVTIDGNTYGKIVVQPDFDFGKLKGTLYLPIIYRENFLDPDDWYRPGGNDEWSFGTDQPAGDYAAIALDAMTDIILKFKYIQWGNDPSIDPFYVQVGNIPSMQLGHGILIRDYANDADFPSIRRIGLNMTVTTGGMRIQGLVNDVADPFLYGLRVQFGANAGFAVSAAADLTPWTVFSGVDAADLTTAQENALAVRPAFINPAIDLHLPVLGENGQTLTLFADAATLIPYIGQAGLGLEEGFQFQSFFTENGFKNYGVEAGGFGRFLILDYRLQLQYNSGAFVPGFYNQPYDRTRGDRAVAVVDYLTNLNDPAYDDYTLGVFGDAGFNLFKDRMVLEIGYLWPWTIEADGSISTQADDYFTLGFTLSEDLLSFLPWTMAASLQYDKVRFRDVFTSDDVRLFDETTVLKGEAVVEVAPGINIALTIGTNVLRDANGNILYENGKPVIGPSIGLETRLGSTETSAE